MPGFCGMICMGFVAIGLMLTVSMASAAADGASGTLQLGTERVALKYVFAVMEKDGVASDHEKLTVFLSDQPVPTELRKASDDWAYWADQQGHAGALHGVALSIDPATGVWSGGRLVTSQGLSFYNESVSSPELSDLKLIADGPIGDHIVGKVSMKNTMASGQDEMGRWKVEGEFRSVVIRRVAVSQVLTGAEALSSAPYKAVLVFLDACRKKNPDAIRNAVEPSSRAMMDEMMAHGKDETLNMFAGMAAETASLKVLKITVRGDSAEIEFGDGKPGSRSTQSLRTIVVDGEWKLAK
jgi:hypothetical protein